MGKINILKRLHTHGAQLRIAIGTKEHFYFHTICLVQQHGRRCRSCFEKPTWLLGRHAQTLY